MLHILWTILIGFVIGLVARFLKPGNDKLSLLWTMVLGVGGSLLAKYVGQSLGWYDEGEPAGFIASVLFAILLLALYAALRKKKGA
ncbi:GlsB/YeaQ/YmgE family stress response membrane protein [Arenimonas sp. MALMAid1274]|uniref:GlsB/YeaQ/YmgE family stress response membrane protein n=1 Tax=Arenimonas sp. MALMAid1274 TaxID=3411630 RepID=UPI003B9E0A80